MWCLLNSSALKPLDQVPPWSPVVLYHQTIAPFNCSRHFWTLTDQDEAAETISHRPSSWWRDSAQRQPTQRQHWQRNEPVSGEVCERESEGQKPRNITSSVILKHNQYVFYDLRLSAKLKEMFDGWNFDGVPPSSQLVSQVLHQIIKCAVLISLWEWSSLSSTYIPTDLWRQSSWIWSHQYAFIASSLNKYLGILMNKQSFQSGCFLTQQISALSVKHWIYPSIHPFSKPFIIWWVKGWTLNHISLFFC